MNKEKLFSYKNQEIINEYKEKIITKLKIINNNSVKKIRLQINEPNEETENLIEVNYKLYNLIEKIENSEFDND